LADQRISQLPSLPQAAVASGDLLPIADVSSSQTKKVTVSDLMNAGIALVPSGSINLGLLDQASATKIGTSGIADDAITAAKLANDSSIAVQTTAPSGDNFEGRGFFNSSTGNLQVYNGSAYQQVVLGASGISDGSITAAKIASGTITTAQISASGLGTAAYADGSVTAAKIASGTITAAQIASGTIAAAQVAAGSIGTTQLTPSGVTYDRIQNVSTDRLLGRSSAGSGTVEEVTCTAAGRALLDDADAATQRATLGLGNLAQASGAWTDGSSFSGTSTGTNTGDQTITLTGDVTGTGSGTFATTIASGAVGSGELADGAVITAKLGNNAVTADKLEDNSAVVVAASTPVGSGAFVGQQHVNSGTGFEYTWTGSEWQRLHGISEISFSGSTPLVFSGSYPDNFSAVIYVSGSPQAATTFWAGPETGDDAAPVFRSIAASDLPLATSGSPGAVQPGTGLAVASGVLGHVNVVSGQTINGFTFDNEGHISAAVALSSSDLPTLDASKIGTGTFGTALIANDAITGEKLADYSTAKIGETTPVADFVGQIFFNPLDKAFYLWDANVWQPIGVTVGEIVFAGTYDASVNQVESTTAAGTAIGLTAGSGLPAASSTNSSYYVVVSASGTGSSPAPSGTLIPPDLLLSDGTAWREIDVSSTYGAQSAVSTSFTPSGTISSTNVQAAIEEVNSSALQKSGDTMTGELLIGSASSLKFEGTTDNGFETTLAVVDPTADQTITFPNETGTVITSAGSGVVTSTMILNGTIVNNDINASAAIAGTKVDPDFGSQDVKTNGVVYVGQDTTLTPGLSNTTVGHAVRDNGMVHHSTASGDTPQSLNRNGDGSVVSMRRSGNQVGSISVTTSTTSYNTSSDYRLKENIEPISAAVDRLLLLKPCRFNFIAEPGRTMDGFLAHETQAVVPEAVTGPKDGEEYQQMDAAKLVPLLVAALQEAIEKVEALDSRISELEQA